MTSFIRFVAILCAISFLGTAQGKDKSVEIWDALPAMDAQHVQGAYAGKRVCPVCRHGYDAGVLAFIPSTTQPETARTLAAQISPAALGVTSSRFRVFALVLGRPPAQLLEALRSNSERWFVAWIDPSDAAGLAQPDSIRAVTFAQRRLLHVFDQHALLQQSDSAAHAAQYAMRFLSSMYPVENPSSDPDSPRGSLWTAPKVLQPRLDLGQSAADRTPVCFEAEKTPLSNAMLSARNSSGRSSWARTDANGCVEVGELREPVVVSVHRRLDEPRTATLMPGLRGAKVLQAQVAGGERIVGLPCEGCDAVFVAMPAQLQTRGRIAGPSEPGESLLVEGEVRDARGAPAAGVVVYAYHTDATGVYPRSKLLEGTPAQPHGRLRGWAVTDAQGRYSFDTIRPAGYPGRNDPAHIHMHVIEPGRCTYYLDELLFGDDPRLEGFTGVDTQSPRGGSGMTTPTKNDRGGQRVVRDIRLGNNIPGYERCDRGTRPAAARPTRSAADRQGT